MNARARSTRRDPENIAFARDQVTQDSVAVRRQIESAIDDRLDAFGSLTPASAVGDWRNKEIPK